MAKISFGIGGGQVNREGEHIKIINGKIYIDGVDVKASDKYIVVEKIEVAGDVGAVVTTVGDVTISGSTETIHTMSGDVTTGDVSGSIKTMSGDVQCKAVGGSINTMSGDVTVRA